MEAAERVVSSEDFSLLFLYTYGYTTHTHTTTYCLSDAKINKKVKLKNTLA